MTAPLFILDAHLWEDLAPGSEVTIDGSEGRHASAVTRVRPGEMVYVTDGAGRRALAEVTHVVRGTIVAKVVEIETVAEPSLRLVLVQALAKGGRDEQAVESATELGVDVVVPWQADRSVARWRPERAAKAREKWVQVTRAATKQSRRSRIPEVTPLATTTDLVARVVGAPLALVLEAGAAETLAGVTLPTEGDVTVIVGPEGGISAQELEALVRAGARPVRLGAEIMRTSSAGPAALAVICAQTRWR
ncbi:MAG TPA: 16S rRNA (uracil(1498)-N(3))-methyltransferase [Candidatus Lustribacter sp.]|nr:16S rRNA (uracil(1498)-N(3))-methyltransferase [Candidatus Lustribacter sp.]